MGFSNEGDLNKLITFISNHKQHKTPEDSVRTRKRSKGDEVRKLQEFLEYDLGMT